MAMKCSLSEELPVEECLIEKEPYYVPVGDEAGIFTDGYNNLLPVNLKGLPGCGKTCFMEYMNIWPTNSQSTTIIRVYSIL